MFVKFGGGVHIVSGGERVVRGWRKRGVRGVVGVVTPCLHLPEGWWQGIASVGKMCIVTTGNVSGYSF